MTIQESEDQGVPHDAAGPDEAEVLDFADVVIGRAAETAALLDAFERVRRDGTTEVVTVAGPPGVGKSTLLRTFDERRSGGVLGLGVSREVGGGPYGALAAALDAIAAEMLGAPQPTFDRWRAELEHQLGDSAGVLAAIVPNLESCLGEIATPMRVSAGDARSRFDRAVEAFVATTSRALGPVVLVLEDLQWAEPGTLRAVRGLLDRAPGQTMIIATWREGEFDPSQLESTSATRTGSTASIELEPFDEREVAAFLDAILGGGQSEDTAETIGRRTGGNPFFLQQFVRRAVSEGALRFDFGATSWRWERDRLHRLETTDNVAALLTETIDDLPDPFPRVLSAVSCIGGPFDLSDALAISSESPELVAEAIFQGQAVGLLRAEAWVDSRPVVDAERSYAFIHDRVAEAARARLDREDQVLAHLRFGRALQSSPDRLLDAVAHLLRAEEALTDSAERADVAALALAAGVRAEESASFPISLDLFTAGQRLLGDDRWTSHRELAMQLQIHALDAAWVTGDWELLDRLHAEAEPYATDPVDRARVNQARLKSLMVNHRTAEAIDLGLELLAGLGVRVPWDPGRRHVAQAALATTVRLRRYSDDDLLALPPCSDPKVIEATRVMAELFNASYGARPQLFPVLVSKAVDLTLQAGLHELSPVALAAFGLLQIALGRYEVGIRLGGVAVELADRDFARRYRPWTNFLYLNFINHWHRPIRSSLDTLREAHREALTVGDVEMAGYLAAVLTSHLFAVGVPVSEFDAEVASMVDSIREHRPQVELCEQVRQLVHNLGDRSPDRYVLAGETAFDEREVIPRAQRDADTVALATYHLSRQGLFYWDREPRRAIEAAATLEDDYLEGLTATAMVPLFHLVKALSWFAVEPRSPETRRAVKATRRKFEKWARLAPANYLAPKLLVDACWAQLRGRTDQAEILVDRAISQADDADFPLYGALAREIAAELYHTTERDRVATTFLRESIELWERIGFHRRVDRIIEEERWFDAGTAPSRHRPRAEPVEPRPAAGELPPLAARAMTSLAAATRARRCVLFLDGSGEIEPVAMATEEGAVLVTPGRARSVDFEVDPSIARRVFRSSTTVREAVGEDAVLVVPVQLGEEAIGAVHLVRDARRPFRSDEEGIAADHADQIAIVIENAQLSDQLRELVDERETLAAAQARFVPTEFLRNLGVEDISGLEPGRTLEHELTVLFADIRNYTGIAEEVGTAATRRLAMDFLQASEPAIVANSGYLHGVSGDEILALFGNTADDAVQAALQMLRSQRRHSERRAGEGARELQAGIGINHGPVTLATVGGVNRMTCGVFGDAVNLASRVESLTRRYGCDLLVTEESVEALADPDRYLIRRAERVRVKNRSGPVMLFEVFDEDEPDRREAKAAASDRYDEAFALFDAGEMEAAVFAFEACLEAVPDDGVAQRHLEAAAHLTRVGLPDGWDGATTLTTK
jgi:predicted ATPase/class 3 adenylate cyclase